MTAKSKSTKSRSDSQYFYKLFRVKRSNGKVTTVSVDPILVAKACRVVPGGLKEVGALVRKAALEFNPELSRNCSGFVSSRLREIVEERSK